jgi:hypothetical protein
MAQQRSELNGGDGSKVQFVREIRSSKGQKNGNFDVWLAGVNYFFRQAGQLGRCKST